VCTRKINQNAEGALTTFIFEIQDRKLTTLTSLSIRCLYTRKHKSPLIYFLKKQKEEEKKREGDRQVVEERGSRERGLARSHL